MSIEQAPVAILIPETAPFTADQRAWLSGFLAAVLVPEAMGATTISSEEASRLLSRGEGAAPALAENEDAPWHDPALLIDDRLAMAGDRSLAPRLMAAMAQQDCGQCGYSCADYANAIFLKQEERLNLCAPGGKETFRAVKRLAEEFAPAQAAHGPAAHAAPASVAALGRTRERPAAATLLSRRLLNAPGSEKQTWHIEIDLRESGINYEVGDCFGVFPKNDLGLVDQIIAMLGAAPTIRVRERTLRDVLTDEVSLGATPDALFDLFSYISGGAAREKARALARGEDPDGDAARLDVLAALQKFPQARPHPEAFVDALELMQPRLYSISSSRKADPGNLSLTVDAVGYVIGKRKRWGVASTYLAERAALGEKLRFYIQPAHNFALPRDPHTPIVMVGPGTGIAPFRAFLQERNATGAQGRNWLFYGHQHYLSDFFYRDELNSMKQSGLLTRLSLAWSRDQDQKFYVQDRMREVGDELWRWLAQGAHFYVCGDARRMAKDVEAVLVEIVARHGARTSEEAVAFVNGLKKSGRYQVDAY